ncbi:MAG: diguanylate cyclase [Planctomycetota bacterium]
MSEDFSKFTRVPSLPTIAIEALKLFQDADSSTDHICSVIRKDPAIVTKLLKAANSPRFGTGRQITDLRHAVTIMGRQSIAPLILSFSLAQQSMENSELLTYYRQFWLRSFMQASAAELIASRIDPGDFRSDCYTTNLLAGIGKLALLRVEPTRYLDCLRRAESECTSVARLEQAEFGFTHHKLSSFLLQSIGLPERCHHAIRSLGDVSFQDGLDSSGPLTRVTRLANAVASILCDPNPGVALVQIEEGIAALDMSMPFSAEQLLDEVMYRITESAELFDISPLRLPSTADLLQDAVEELARIAATVSSPQISDNIPVELVEENGRLKRRVADLVHVSKLDALTGVFNRAYLLQELEERASLHRVRGQSLGLALVDIDHFKNINDTYGHLAGDAALKVVAQTLIDTLRDTDIVGRWGGEEFVAILNDTNASGLAVVGERIRSRIEAAVVNYQGQRIPMTVSIGLAEGHVLGKTQDFGNFLFASADAAMYQAKQAGRNRFVVHSLQYSSDYGTTADNTPPL